MDLVGVQRKIRAYEYYEKPCEARSLKEARPTDVEIPSVSGAGSIRVAVLLTHPPYSEGKLASQV
ncbi:MAG: hypothetical protein JWO38_3779 [Gemmataceae bacterium]|nr:hypothetical protein [Gemmataceae bacterium]